MVCRNVSIDYSNSVDQEEPKFIQQHVGKQRIVFRWFCNVMVY